MMVLQFSQANDFMGLPESAVRVNVLSVPESCLNYGRERLAWSLKSQRWDGLAGLLRGP